MKKTMLKKITKRQKIKLLLKSLFSTFKVPYTGDILKFAEEYRVLSRNESSVPGPYRAFPYQKLPYEVIHHPDFQELCLVWGAQLGKSNLFENIILYYMISENSSVMVMWPTLDAARKCASDKVMPMLNNSPKIKHMLFKQRSKNKNLYKKLKNGSYIRIVSCTPSELAGESVRVTVADELDRAEDRGEGDPLILLHKRCASFPNAIKLTTSTPTTTQGSKIWKRFLLGTQHYYYLTSPYTGEQFTLTWECMKIDRENPENSILIDPTCGKEIPDELRKKLIYNGEWKKTKESGIYSFHLSGMYRVTPTTKGYKSAYHQWALDYLAAEGDKKKMMGFYNTFLALPVEEKEGEKLEAGDWEKYLIDIDFNKIPNDIIAATAGIDIQANRKEIYIYGWTSDCRPTLLENETVYGEPQDTATWEEIDKLLLTREYIREDGIRIKINKAFIDSGNWQRTVLDYTDNKSYRGIYPVKGASVVDAPLIENAPNRKNKQYILGTNEAKDLIFSDYALGRIRFNRKYADKEYFAQLFSEVKIIKDGKVRYDNPDRNRNEALDCFVYAYAAAKSKNFLKIQMSNVIGTPEDKKYIPNSERDKPSTNQTPVQETKPEQINVQEKKKYIPNWMRR